MDNRIKPIKLETELQALEESLRIWNAIVQGGDGTLKQDVMQILVENLYDGACPLCEYYRTNLGMLCGNCPLAEEGIRCYYYPQPFSRWDKDHSKESAIEVLTQLELAYEKLI